MAGIAVVTRVDSESVIEFAEYIIEPRDSDITEDAVVLPEVFIEDRGSDDIEYVEGVDGATGLVECVIEDRGPEGVEGRQPQNCAAFRAPELVTARVGLVILPDYAARHLNGLAVLRLDMPSKVGWSRVGPILATGLLAT